MSCQSLEEEVGKTIGINQEHIMDLYSNVRVETGAHKVPGSKERT
jgi:hypothetical protein